MTPALISQLQNILGAQHVHTTDDARTTHALDQSPYTAVMPDVVVYPGSTEDVSAIVRLANENHVPVVGRGAGTSLEGNAIPLQGGIVVNFARMNNILQVYPQDFQVRVQPGIFYRDMNKILADDGLMYAVDSGANASIGGMIANNAAGTRTVKYGATRDNVLALEVVLASGEVIRTGSRSVKQSAGYDLTHLITGSEGTLGLVTEATLKLVPLPRHFSAATASFPSTGAAANAVFEIMRAGLNPAALELVDGGTLAMLLEAADLGLDPAPTLFMEFHGASEASLHAELELAQNICLEQGCTAFKSGMGQAARDKLWAARYDVRWLSVKKYPDHAWTLTDVAVPVSHFPEIVAYADELIHTLDLPGSIILGHAGDGNMHTSTPFMPDDTAAAERAHELNLRLVHRALELGGTCTGEHGVGTGKQKFMEQEHGAGALALMRLLKRTLDPNNILNPGKVFALEPATPY